MTEIQTDPALAPIQQEAPQFNFVVAGAAAPVEAVEAAEEVAVAAAEAAPVAPKKKRKRKAREGDFQNEFQRKPFQELVRDIVAEKNGGNAMRIGPEAFELLQMAAENLLVELFADTNKITLNRKGKTIVPRDFLLATALRRDKVLDGYEPVQPAENAAAEEAEEEDEGDEIEEIEEMDVEGESSSEDEDSDEY